MSNPPDDLALGQSLRDGLHALPVPPVASNFDARVLAALRAPMPWWRRWWEPARPLLLGASCSLLVTLALLHWALSAPVGTPSPRAAPSALAAAPARAPSLDSLLDRPGLRAGSLAAWGSPVILNSGATAPDGGTGEDATPPGRRPNPPRHAQAGRRACLIV